MGARSLMSGDRTVTFTVDQGGVLIQLKLCVRGKDVVLEALSGPDEGKSAVIADCMHLIS